MRASAGTVCVGVLLLAAGELLDARSLYVPGLLILGLTVTTQLWVRVVARGVRVSRRLGARRVLEGEPVEVAIEVRAGRVPLGGGVVTDPLARESLVLRCGARRASMRFVARFDRRGRRRLAAPVAELRDPLGLARRRVWAGESEDEVLVLPRTGPVAVGGESAVGRSARSPLALTAAVELDGLRPYREGTPASRIHWPALARGAGLIERRMRSELDARPLVILDPRDPARPDDLDAAVRAAASLILALARDGGCAALLPGDRRPTAIAPELGGWRELHARLALVDEHGPAPLARGAGGAPRGGPIICVAARLLRRAPRGLRELSRSEPVLVVPGRLPGRPVSFAVAGCWGYVDARAGVRAAARA